MILPFRRGGLVINAPSAKNVVRPRWVAFLWAKAFGYFWLPCPICNRKFAGFEWGASLYKGKHAGTGCCARPLCRAEAKMINDGCEPMFSPSMVYYFDPDSLWVKFVGIKWLGAAVLWVAAVFNFVSVEANDTPASYVNFTIAVAITVMGFVSLWVNYIYFPRQSAKRHKEMNERLEFMRQRNPDIVPIVPHQGNDNESNRSIH